MKMIEKIENAIVNTRNQPTLAGRELAERLAYQNAVSALKDAEQLVDNLQRRGEHDYCEENKNYRNIAERYTYGSKAYREAVAARNERLAESRKAGAAFDGARDRDVIERQTALKASWLKLCSDVIAPALAAMDGAIKQGDWRAPMVRQALAAVSAIGGGDRETAKALTITTAAAQKIGADEAAACAARLAVLLWQRAAYECACFADCASFNSIVGVHPLRWHGGLPAALAALAEAAALFDGRAPLALIA